MRLSGLAAKIRPGVFAELQRRIDERAAAGAKIVGLHIGDTHVSPPKESRLPHLAGEIDVDATYRYGATAGTTELREAIAERMTRVRGVPGVTADNVLTGAGGTHALFCVAKAVLDPGDDVLLFAPYWPLAHGIFTSCGANVVEVSVSQPAYDNPALDLTPLLSAHLTPRTKAIYFVSPNNPDGKILSRAQLMQIASFAEAHDLFVFADEVYADIVYGDGGDGNDDAKSDAGIHGPPSFGALPGGLARSALLYSFSKSHALAGARIGYVVAPKEVIGVARRVSVHTVFNVPVTSQRAALLALAHGAAFQREAREKYRAARDRSVAALRGYEGVRFHAPEGATYVFCDFADALRGRPLVTLLERAVDEGVLVAPGESFGATFTTHARICFTSVPEAELVSGLEALGRALDAIRTLA
jgi:aspartate/methionine/tyrosine aminotransferase